MNKRRSVRAANPVGRQHFLARWAQAHGQACLFSLGQAFRSPLATLMTVTVIGIALALPAGMFLITANLQALAGRWDDSVQISVFLDAEVDAERARQAAVQWAKWPRVQGTEVIDPEQALADYRRLSGLGEALDLLPENPFPMQIVVEPGPPAPTEQAPYAELLQRLRDQDGVAQVQLDTEWVQRLFALLELGRRLVSITALLLGLGVVLIIGNAIRYNVEQRREDIQIARIFGATKGFIRRPFLYGGLVYGLGGGVLAALMLGLAGAWLAPAAQRLAALYGSPFTPVRLSIWAALGLAAAGALLGMFGAWLSVARHLRASER